MLGSGIFSLGDRGILVPKHYDFDFEALVFVKDTGKVYKVAFYKSWDCALSYVIPVGDSFAAVGSGFPPPPLMHWQLWNVGIQHMVA